MRTFEIKRVNNVICGPKHHFDIDNRGVGRFIFDKINRNAQKTFQINAVSGEEETYEFVNKKCIRLALEMKNRGIRTGDLVLICSSNNMDSVVPMLATFYINAITSTLDPFIPLRDTAHLLKIVQPKMIFVEDTSIELIESALKESNFQTQLVVIGSSDRHSTYAEFLKPKDEEESFLPDIAENIKEEAAIVFFSSGTTGLPKGITMSHFSVLYMIETTIDLCTEEYRNCIPITTLYWISAVALTLITIRNGGKRVVIKGFQPELTLQSIEKYQVDALFLAPALSYRITDELVKKHPCPELKYIWLGGSSITNEQMKKLRNKFPRSNVNLAYAQTESGGLITTFTHHNYSETNKGKATSSGFPMANTNIKIVDIDTEVVLGPNQKGEIRVLIPCACNGYYNQISDIFDKDGYIKTGDVGYYDEDNCLYVCDRIKDMFKYQGWHIVPLSLENVISEHPAISEVIVIGIPSELDGHIPMALVTLRPDVDDVSENDLLSFSNGRLSEREQLRGGLKIVKSLPKGATGKIARKQITDLVVSEQIQKLMN